MKVRALKTFVSPVLSCSAGDTFDVSPEQGKAWILAGLVAPVETEPRTATAPAPEIAVARGRRSAAGPERR